MHDTLGGCFGSFVGFVAGLLAGLLLGEHVVKPGLDGLVTKLAIAGVAALLFAAIGFKLGKRAAGRPNPTDE